MKRKLSQPCVYKAVCYSLLVGSVAVGCKPRSSGLSDVTQRRNESLETRAMYELMQRPFEEGTTVFLHTDLFRETIGGVDKTLPPGMPTWIEMFRANFKHLDESSRVRLAFAYYNFFEQQKLAEPWNVEDKFRLIDESSATSVGRLNHYLLEAEIVKTIPATEDTEETSTTLGKVEWLMDTEYAPEAVRMMLLMVTTPMLDNADEKVADNFFDPFFVDNDSYYQVKFVGLPWRYSPVYLEPCNNPGRPYTPEDQTQPARANRFTPGSGRTVVSVYDQVKNQYQDAPFGSLMLAADNQHGAEFLTGVNLGDYLFTKEETEGSNAETAFEAAAGAHDRFNSSLRSIVVTRLLINTLDDITKHQAWNGKKRPIVIGFPTKGQDIMRRMNEDMRTSFFMGHKFHLRNFNVKQVEIKDLVLTRKFLPDLARRGCGGGTRAEILMEEAGYKNVQLPDRQDTLQPLRPESPKPSSNFPFDPSPAKSSDRTRERGGH